MSIKTIGIKYSEVNPLLLNNPQMVDPLNRYKKEASKITKKRNKTDDDHAELRTLEVEAKLYWDSDLGVYVPSSWVSSSIAQVAFKLEKISKADIRGSVFTTENKIKLNYQGSELVKAPADIIKNSDFHILMNLKQGQVRVAKAFPIFKGWSFETEIEYDDSIIDPDSLERLIKHAAKYVGMGDFRPTYGRCTAEVTHV
ncbi:MAG: hypothetical protein DRQ39_03720 [Gammaproteobacteria bacterium]|nr:MAG: hypothetical protein DRQ39_03720 [Gammaproteobacteria bacterium]